VCSGRRNTSTRSILGLDLVAGGSSWSNAVGSATVRPLHSAPFEWSSWGNEVDYPVLFGTTQATWGQIDLRFELLTDEVDPDRIARVFVVPFIGTACVVIGFEHGGWDQQAVAWSQARASR
jgi:hypothetical protein